MKRSSVILGLLLLIALPLLAEHVDPETARKVATTFLSNNGAKANQLTDLSKGAGFPNLYIFTTEDSFVIVPNDDRIQPILGYSADNPFFTEDMPANLRWWLSGYDERIVEIRNNNEIAPEEIQQEWKDLIFGKNDPKTEDPVQSVAPLISTHWAQGAPFNNLCPANTVTGCVATAMAQVMKKWNYPTTGIGSHSYTHNSVTHTANFGATTYDWENMINSYAGEYDAIQATAVATLMRHCGVSVEMKYVPGGESSSTTKRACIALNTYFNYTGTYLKKSTFDDDASWISRVKQDLNQDMPLLYGGFSSSEGGHAFVCDGYDASDRLHFDWGWGPNSNGYYTVNGHDYHNDQDAVFGIHPNICNAEKPTNLNCSAKTGHVVTLTWNPGINTIANNIYRNNTLIGTTEANLFVDTEAVPGDNIYYIRSVDNDGRLSLASNQITENVSFQTPAVEDLNAYYSGNNPMLSWSTPWWHPQTSNGTIAYVDEIRPNLDSYIGWDKYSDQFMLYWGSLYPKEDLTEHQGKAVYKTTFYTLFPGNYKVLIYQGTDSETQYPKELKAVQSINTAHNGWIEISLDEPVFIDSSKDLWVFIYDADGKMKQIPCLDVAEETNHQFFTADRGGLQYPPHEGCSKVVLSPPFVWFIRTYLTDGTYSYNLYDDDNLVNASPISETSYSVSDPSNGLHPFTVKTFLDNNQSGTSNTANLIVGDFMLNNLVLEDDNITVAPSSTLTLNGTVSNDSPANLIIEDGGQLIHPASAVKATLKKAVSGFGEDLSVKTGWYTIASPVADALTDLATDGTYDLYAYDEPSRYWKNQKIEANDITTFSEGHGLLYANANDKSLVFAGDMKATGSNISLPLRYTEHEDGLAGFNLIGNPFSCNINSGDIYFNDTALTVYYSVENGENITAHHIGVDPIKPGQGFFVQATGKGQNIEFHPTTSSKGDNDSYRPAFISIKAGNDNFMDCVIIQIGGGNTLRKMRINDNVPQLYVMHDGKDYAAATISEAQGEIPVHFKATQNGTYTLTLSGALDSRLSTLNHNYLHLIDNLTGADIDLLVTPSYTFEARTDDYPSRFRLLMKSTDEDQVEMDGTLEGDIQIIDMTGRIVATDRNAKLTPGIYILRTINGNDTKTEKIRVK